MRWVLKESVYKKASGLISTLAVVLICAERANSFAQSQTGAVDVPPGPAVQGEERIEFGSMEGAAADGAGEAPLRESNIPLSERYLGKFEVVKTKQQACELLEGRIVTYYDVASLVRGCKQHVIEDAELLNELVHSKRRKVVEVPARVYRLIPFGKPLSKSDLDAPGNAGKRLSKDECAEIDKSYVTVSGMTYYYIDGCKRRAFDSYDALQEHNVTKSTIVTLSPETLYRIAEGPGMKATGSDEQGMLMRMDGDVKWSRLARANRDGSLPNDTPTSLKAIDKSGRGKVDREALCRKYNGKVVSFYSQVYFLEQCRRRTIEGFSLRLQQRVQAGGGIVDITPEEFKAIPAGKAIGEDEVLKLLR